MHHAPATATCIAVAATAAAATVTVTTTTAAAAAATADADSSAVPDREGIRAALTAARGRFAAAAITQRVQLHRDLPVMATLTSNSGTKFVCLMCTFRIVSSGEEPALDI